jgi:hypothetical protein
MIAIKTTRKELSFHVQGKRVSHDKETLVSYDAVVRGHIKDGSLEIIDREEEKPIKLTRNQRKKADK